ncbi:MAG TPA: thioredoxin domain-containing protein, partial [Xanthobacteraceae bacterium]|nr:thioredoxin domain-containing protein [Xanthobacteraceae bacterium]
WLAREMTTEQGAFCASLDADSEGEEGKFYVWSYDEILRLLGVEDGAFFAETYGATPDGNFEGHNILNLLKDLPRSISRSAEDEARLTGLRWKLLAARDQRVRPGLDDKVLADWNGLMIAALANAGALLSEPAWIGMAARAFAFIARAMTRTDRLGHSWREARLLFPGLASDFAAMIKAALALNEATGERAYLDQAIAWQRAVDRHYGDPHTGGYLLTADDAEGLVVRPNSTLDDATPNPNALAAQNLVRLAVLAGDDAWRTAADRLFDGMLPIAAENLFGHAALLNALDLRLRAAEIVIVGADAEPLVRAALALPFLDRILLRAPSADALAPAHPARAKLAAAPAGAAFVCVGETCSLPVTDPAGLPTALAAVQNS